MNCCSCLKDNVELYQHPLLRVPTCQSCCNLYNNTDFKAQHIGRNFLICSWCTNGEGELVQCEVCPRSFCTECIARNFGNQEVVVIKQMQHRWKCFCCEPSRLVDLCLAHNWDPGVRKSKVNYRGDKVINNDISKGREIIEIPVVNEENDETPDAFVYVTSFVFDEKVEVTNSPELLSCCSCANDCSTLSCPCQQKTGHVAYDFKGATTRSHPFGVFECNQRCTCHRSQCKNRVVTKGPMLPLEVFYCGSGKGWGVRCRVDIPSGTFVADYLGEILPESLTDARGKSRQCDGYLFALDHWARSESHWKAVELGLTVDKEERSNQVSSDKPLATNAEEEDLMRYLDEDLMTRLRTSGAIDRAHALGEHIIKSTTVNEESMQNWMRDQNRNQGAKSVAMEVAEENSEAVAKEPINKPTVSNRAAVYSVPISKLSGSQSSSCTESSSAMDDSSGSASSGYSSTSSYSTSASSSASLRSMNRSWAQKDKIAHTLLMNQAKHTLLERELEKKEEGELLTIDARSD